MDISCPQCQTVYEVEELNAYSPAISLQCSECNFIFRLRAPGRSIEENQLRWMIRNSTQGDILYFNTFDVLHRWIMEGSVSGDDAISRTGERWMALKNIGEFAPIFQTVESIAKIADTRPGPASTSAFSPKSAAKPTIPAVETEEVATKVIPSPKFQPPQIRPPHAQATAPDERPKSHTLPFGIAASARNPVPPARNSHQTLPGLTHTHPPRSTTSSAPSQPLSSRHTAVTRPPALDYPTSPAAQEDDWSFSDSTPEAEFRESAQQDATKTWVVHAPNETPPRSSRRRTVTIVAAICILTGLGAAAFFTLEPLQEWRASAFAPRDVIPLGDLAVAEEISESALEVSEKQPEQPHPDVALSALHATSSQQIHRALTSASEQQKLQYRPAPVKPERTPDKSVKAEKPAVSAQKFSDNNNLQSVLARAKLALEGGKPTQARQLYHQAVRLDAQNAEAIAGLGWSLLAMGNPDSARAQFRRAKYRDPSFEGSYIGLGRAERDLGNLEEALSAYEDYLKRFPDGPEISIARYQSEELKRQLGR